MCVISTCLAHGHCTVAILIISRWPPLCQPAFQAMTGHTKTNSAKPRFKLLANTSYLGQRPKRSADTSSQMKVPPPAEDTAGHFTKQNDGGDLPQAKKQVVAKHVAGSPAAKQAGSAPRVVPKEHFRICIYKVSDCAGDCWRRFEGVKIPLWQVLCSSQTRANARKRAQTRANARKRAQTRRARRARLAAA
jgi:hypothetical protein